jgi:hypothetical protein
MRAVKIAAVVGIFTSPLDVIAHHDVAGIIRLCEFDGWTCADELAGLLGEALGLTSSPVFLVVMICSVRNLLVLRRL